MPGFGATPRLPNEELRRRCKPDRAQRSLSLMRIRQLRVQGVAVGAGDSRLVLLRPREHATATRPRSAPPWGLGGGRRAQGRCRPAQPAVPVGRPTSAPGSPLSPWRLCLPCFASPLSLAQDPATVSFPDLQAGGGGLPCFSASRLGAGPAAELSRPAGSNCQPRDGGMREGRGTTKGKATCLQFQFALSLSLSQTSLCTSSLRFIAGDGLRSQLYCYSSGERASNILEISQNTLSSSPLSLFQITCQFDFSKKIIMKDNTLCYTIMLWVRSVLFIVSALGVQNRSFKFFLLTFSMHLTFFYIKKSI
jgi:hypothetical protein